MSLCWNIVRAFVVATRHTPTDMERWSKNASLRKKEEKHFWLTTFKRWCLRKSAKALTKKVKKLGAACQRPNAKSQSISGGRRFWFVFFNTKVQRHRDSIPLFQYSLDHKTSDRAMPVYRHCGHVFCQFHSIPWFPQPSMGWGTKDLGVQVFLCYLITFFPSTI